MKKIGFGTQVAVSALLLFGAGLAWQYQRELSAFWGLAASETVADARADRAEGTPVIVAAARMVDDDLTFAAIGTGFAFRSVTLRAATSGEVIALDVAAGRRFAAGDTLMRLQDTDQRLAVALAEARLERATEERDRLQRLQDRGAAAIARLEEALTNFKVAEIAFEQARADLDDRVLRAPFDGITGLSTVEIGDRVAADDPVASFDDRSRILVEFDLPEALLGRVSRGLAVLATTPSVEGRSFDGEITAIDSRVNAGTRTARVRASIDNQADFLRPGASFALRLDLPGRPFPAVPELALQFSEGSLHVWRVADGMAEQVPVQLVRRRGGLVIVDGPLAPQDQIVVEGTQRLRAGGAVRILNAADEPSS
jgi:RND family efflux transporter MFP subunit